MRPHPINPSLENVTLRRGRDTIFQSLTLRLSEHRIGVIGDNGAGKSSLFRLLCGLDQPLSGRVQWGEQQQASIRIAGLVGMMFQNPDEQIVYPTVDEELALSLSPQGFSRRQALEQAQVFLRARGLDHWIGRAIGSLSHGQRQQVCWLSLLIAAPGLLLLDEPFASLDLPGQAPLAREMAQAPQQLIVASHILGPLRKFDRVIWLENGRIRADGPAQPICDAYEIHASSETGAQL